MGTGRLGSRKSRTGCTTCKIRRVKCDEKKPFCYRCTSTGRKCDGYAEATKNIDAKSLEYSREENSFASKHPSPELGLSNITASKQEARSISFYRAQVAPTLSGTLDSGLWEGIVLQASHHEPAIRQAICAVSSLFEQQWRTATHSALLPPQRPSTSSAIPMSRNEDYKFAIKSYSKAIDIVKHLVNSDDPPYPILLLTCILFICIEFLQGNAQEALDLWTGGYKLLHSQRQKDEYQWCDAIFARMKVVAALQGQGERDVDGILQHTDYPVPRELLISDTLSPVDARTRLFEIMADAHCLVRKAMAYSFETDFDPRILNILLDEKQNLYHRLQLWQTAFVQLRSNITTESDRTSCQLLQIYSQTTSIWLQTLLDSAGENAFDFHRDTFNSIVQTATSLVMEHSPKLSGTVSTSNDTAPIFTFEMGTVPPLYFCATKCREPSLRRAAVSLLQRSPRREGLWDAAESAAVAKRIIALEEEDHGWPEESRRICDALVGPSRAHCSEWGVDVEFRYRRFDGGGFRKSVEFVPVIYHYVRT